MVPYFIWALIYVKISHVNILKIIYGSYATISETGTLTSLWFLPYMFVASIFFKIIIDNLEKFNIRRIYLLLISCLLSVLLLILTTKIKIDLGYPWCIDISICATLFMIFGYIFAKFVKGFIIIQKIYT